MQQNGSLTDGYSTSSSRSRTGQPPLSSLQYYVLGATIVHELPALICLVVATTGDQQAKGNEVQTDRQ